MRPLEGEEVQVNGSGFIIDSLLVAPYNRKLHGKFISDYDNVNSDIDDISLATSLNTEFYTVLVLYRDNGTTIYEDIFKVLKRLQIELDLAKYGIEVQ